MIVSGETKQYRQNIIKQYLSKSTGVLHLGAHLGQEAQTYSEANKNVVWVEALPSVCSELTKKLTQFPGQRALCALLDKVNGFQREFKISNNAGGVSSSIYEFGEYGNGAKSLWPELNLCMLSSITLPTTRLDSLLEQNNIDCPNFDFWVIDLQGAELLALEGAGRCINDCKAIYIEVSKVEVYQGGVLWGELSEWMKLSGFIPLWQPEVPHDDILFVHQSVYKNVFDDFHSEHYIRHNSRRLEHLASLNLPLANCRVLEVGAGVGDHTSFYLDRGCTVTVTDIRPENLMVLRERFKDCSSVNVCMLDMENPDQFDDGEFYDVIHCYGLLYHLKDPENALRYLATKGALLCLETCVSNIDYGEINNIEEPCYKYSQSFYGVGCRPSKSWLLDILRRYFSYAELTSTQPNHPEFTKSNCLETAILYRQVFIAKN